MNILDFNALPDYLEQMEIDAEKDMPANLYGWERLRREKKYSARETGRYRSQGASEH
jgi:hypothetical protein